MSDALATGAARPLSRFVTDFVHHGDHWWLLSAEGWLRVDDPGLLAVLNKPRQWIED
ncbi:hypothetical protein [Cryptosporangium sp. NPDC048952]|uniref:hypothetical protein n=1 Tax=Cryptosporangium sp. NPDC048952 TaxID=3363961 RepID=UPI0037163EEA